MGLTPAASSYTIGGMDMTFDQLAQDVADAGVPKGPARPPLAPTMGNLAKVGYSHDAMIDLILANPRLTQNQLAAYFGYSVGWVSNIMAADAFQARMAERRAELVDPTLRATLEERYRGLAIQSLDRLQERLAAPQVSDTLLIRAAELGAKATGVGGHAPIRVQAVDLGSLAHRLVALQSQVHEGAIEGESSRVDEKE